MGQAAKTKEKNRSAKESWISGLVASAKGSLVPVKKTEPKNPALEKTLTTVRPEATQSTATRVSIRSGDLTSPSRIQAAQKQKSQTRTDVSQVKEADNDKTRKLGLFLVVIMICLIGMGWMISSDKTPAPAGHKYDRAKIQERVNYHRQHTGMKLNSDRINTEYENVQTAPPIGLSGKRVPAPNMMDGVPLAAEPLHRKSSRDRLVPTNPDYPDARVMYGLQEEQASNEWEDEAQKKYIEAFVKNAAAAGYRVKVDQDLNVTVKPGGRNPQSTDQSGDARGGMSQ